MARRYPLQPLLGMRRDQVERKALEHQRAVAASEQQDALVRAARERRECAAAVTRQERLAERSRLDSGAARAADLHQTERYLAGAAARAAELAAREREAAERARAAGEARHRARAELARARADEDAVSRHARRFRETLARTAESADEEAAAEHWAVSRRGAQRA